MSSLVTRVATRYRVAQRYRNGGQLGVGRTLQTPTLRVHRFRDHIRVTDLTNAGKRGKAVEQFSVSPGYGWGMTGADRDAWLDQTAAAFERLAPRGYDALLAYIKDEEKDARSGTIEFNTQKLRGVDVEPYGEVFEFEIRQPNGGSIEVKSSPLEFRVTDRHWFDGPEGKDGFFQDTSYHPRKKKDAMAFYAWMKENHERARRFMKLDMFRKTWDSLGVSYDYH